MLGKDVEEGGETASRVVEAVQRLTSKKKTLEP
jgi:hypothetical protein